MSDVVKFSWPASRLGEAIKALARESNLSPRQMEVPPFPRGLEQGNDETLGGWIEAVAAQMGLEAEAVWTLHGEMQDLVHGAGPALLCLPGEGEMRFLALLDGGRRTVAVLGPDRTVHRLRLEIVRAALCQKIKAPVIVETDRLLKEIGVSVRRRTRARAAILRERLSTVRIGGCWRLRLLPGASFWKQIRQIRLPRRVLIFVGAHTAQYLLWILAWWVVGQGALQGRLDRGWLVAWVILLLTLVPIRLLATWSQGQFTVGAGKLLKHRFLYGALCLDPEEIRHKGAGQLLGQVLEVQAVEYMALGGGYRGIVAGIEILVATTILGAGVGGRLHAFLLLGWVAVTAFIGWRYLWQRRRWTDARLTMTHDLVERMVGYRTCLAQEMRERWHDGENQALEHYLDLSGSMDRVTAWMIALIPRGWLILGLLGLAPAFVAGRSSPAAIAVGLGGTVLAYRAMKKLAEGLLQVTSAAIAWQQAAPLFHAATRPQTVGSPTFALAPGSDADGSEDKQPLLDARDLTFRYHDRGAFVLQGCTMHIYKGDRLLLASPSGSGKSTLVSLLTGLRDPASGLVLRGGLDRQTWGSEYWRQRVAAAPQFHENHILTETFAFNLLMGRCWPPRRGDLEEAESVCRELGLGELLDRMPGGILQMVGETGWRLSHGEMSRLYIARALLQGADLLILDESFGTLDPENLQRALHCVLARTPTLLVIAYP